VPVIVPQIKLKKLPVFFLPRARAVIVQQIRMKKLPVDSNAIYLVLTSKDVKVWGACNDYCGWHSQFKYQDGTPLSVALVMDAGQCVAGCGFSKGYISITYPSHIHHISITYPLHIHCISITYP